MVVAVVLVKSGINAIRTSRRSQQGKIVQGLRSLFTAVILVLVAASEAHAGGMVAAYPGAKEVPRDPTNFGAEYEINFAPKPGKSSSLPEYKKISLPVTIGVVDRSKFYLPNKPCYIPRESFVTLDLFKPDKIRGDLIWPQGYVAGPAVCRDQVEPISGKCADGKAPELEACANGAAIEINFAEAVGDDHKPVDSQAIIENIRRATQP